MAPGKLKVNYIHHYSLLKVQYLIIILYVLVVDGHLFLTFGDVTFKVLTGAQWAQALALLEELEKQLVEANAVPWPHVIPKMEGFEVGRLAGYLG